MNEVLGRRASGLWVPWVKGHVQIALEGEGIVYETDNLFVDDGYAKVAGFLGNAAPAVPGFIAVGNGDGTTNGATVSPLPIDHALAFELQRNTLTAQTIQQRFTSRLTTLFVAGDVQRRLTEVGLFDTAGDKGTATAGAAGTLTDGGKAWTVNGWQGWTVFITGGTGKGQSAVIASNTATVLTIVGTWGTNPDNTSTYCIGGVNNGNNVTQTKYMLARAAVQVVKGNQTMTVLWSLTTSLS